MSLFGLVVLLLVLLVLSALLVRQVIHVSAFVSLGVFWLIASLILILGPETISEFTVWNTSVKRDVLAARQFRDETQQIRDSLRRVTKSIVEDSYILASESFLAMGGDSAAKQRIEKNLKELSKFAEPINENEEEWWKELHNLYDDRRRGPPVFPVK
jgi:hypothetical protein